MATDLSERVDRFMSFFNTADLDEIVDTFVPEGEYHDPNGARHKGRDALRAAFAPLFDGTFGAVAYEVTETILDEGAGRALVTWNLTMTGADGVESRVRGLDILHFGAEGLSTKNCFCKADALHFE